MLQVLGGGVEIIRERLISDTTVVGPKNIAINPPVESLDRTIYIPQVVSGGGYPGTSPLYLGNNVRWEMNATNNLLVTNSGDAAGLYPFRMKILEVNRDLNIQLVSANLTYGPGPSINNVAISPVPDLARVLVIPLWEYQKSYDRPNWVYYQLVSNSILQVVAWQYSDTSTAVAKILIVNLF